MGEKGLEEGDDLISYRLFGHSRCAGIRGWLLHDELERRDAPQTPYPRVFLCWGVDRKQTEEKYEKETCFTHFRLFFFLHGLESAP